SCCARKGGATSSSRGAASFRVRTWTPSRRWVRESSSGRARRRRISSTTSRRGSPSTRPRKRDRHVTTTRLRELSEELRALEARLREGGGPRRIEKQHAQGKLTARERVERLCDVGARFIELGLLVAYDRYDGQAPAAGVVTGVGVMNRRPVVVVANDATVKAGSWWPETITKILRAQEVAMRCRIPIVYLVDSAGVNLPYQGGVFPGQYGASRI